MSEQTDRIMGTRLERTAAWVRDELQELSQRNDALEADRARMEKLEAAMRAWVDYKSNCAMSPRDRAIVNALMGLGFSPVPDPAPPEPRIEVVRVPGYSTMWRIECGEHEYESARGWSQTVAGTRFGSEPDALALAESLRQRGCYPEVTT